MRPIRSAILAGLGIAALAGAAYAAANEHVLQVRLPDGSVERIHYLGDVRPRIVLVPTAAIAPAAFADPFAEMDRMFAAMDAHADAMMRQAAMLAAQAPDGTGDAAVAAPGMTPGMAPGMTMVSSGALPAGTQSYSVVSTMVNGRTCTRSTRLIAGSAGARPQLVSQTSGDGCAAAPAHSPADAAPATRATAPILPVSAPAAKPAAASEPTV